MSLLQATPDHTWTVATKAAAGADGSGHPGTGASWGENREFIHGVHSSGPSPSQR